MGDPPPSYYETSTSVEEELGLLMDFEEVSELLNAENFETAVEIYENGAHSKPTAELTLVEATSVDYQQFSVVQGTTNEGEDVVGRTAVFYAKGTKKIKVLYSPKSDKPETECRTQGVLDPVLKGCFMEENTIYIDGESYKYSYDPSTDNKSSRSLKGLSIHADRRFRMSQHAPIAPDLEPYVSFFGHADYGDRLVRQALLAVEQSDEKFKPELITIIESLISYFHLGHFMIRDMEMATFQCHEENEDRAIEALDRAYALFHGGTGSRWLHLANQKCREFKTCTGKHSLSGSSRINENIKESFVAMKEAIPKYNCATVRARQEVVVSQLKAAAFQGILSSTYKATTQNRTSVEQRVVDMYSSILSPWILQCHPSDLEPFRIANGITGSEQTGMNLNYDAAAGVVERNYRCLQVACADVGGLWDAKNKEYIRSPCMDESTKPIVKAPRNFHVRAILGTLIVLFATYLGYMRYKKNQALKARRERRRAADPNFYDSDDDSDSSSSFEGLS